MIYVETNVMDLIQMLLEYLLYTTLIVVCEEKLLCHYVKVYDGAYSTEHDEQFSTNTFQPLLVSSKMTFIVSEMELILYSTHSLTLPLLFGVSDLCIVTGTAVWQFAVDAEEIKRLGKRFRKLDLDQSGSLSVEEFMSLPELHQNPLVQRVIDIFDTDGNGEVDFKGMFFIFFLVKADFI